MKTIVRHGSLSPKGTWLKLDANGNSSILDMDKYEIMRRVCIDARDLKILDPFLSYPSTILGRKEVIVLNLEHIKAIITAKEVFLQDPTDKDVIPVVRELERRLASANLTNQGDDQDYASDVDEEQQAQSPFEFLALEIFLEAICSFLDARAAELEMATYPTLQELTTKISSQKLDQIRKLKSSMTGLIARVQKVREELEQLMDDDSDMADLYLSRKLVAISSPIREVAAAESKNIMPTFLIDDNDVEEVEILLEAYFIQIDGTLSRLINLREYTQDTEDYINIHIDNRRNQLIQLEIFLNFGELSLALYSAVTAILGMSIPYSWNTGHNYLFKWVVIFLGVFCILVLFIIVSYAKKRGLVLGS